MKCEEYVGPASATGQRSNCQQTARWMASRNPESTPTRLGAGLPQTITLCTRHAREYERNGWTIINFG